MFSLRFAALMMVGIAALIAGAVLMTPEIRGERVALSIKGVSVNVEIANDDESRTRGLAGRGRLGEGEGMLFLFSEEARHAVWMKGVAFPLDIVWIRRHRVVDLRESVLPPPVGADEAEIPILKPTARADAVLELPAGFLRAHSVAIGDPVSILWQEPDKQAAAVLFAADGTNVVPRGAEYFIETLKRRSPQGRAFRLGKEIRDYTAYREYEFSYRSGPLILTGLVNIPSGKSPAGGFPLIVLNHGNIPPGRYKSGNGTARAADFFARRGYIALRPDYRGYADSSPNPNVHYDFFAGYANDVIDLLDALEGARPAGFDVTRVGIWGHSMGGAIAMRAALVRPEVRAFVLVAPASSKAEENLRFLSQDERARVEREYGDDDDGGEVYRQISPYYYVSDIAAPFQIHHGLADAMVPVQFSKDIASALNRAGKRSELYTYAGEGHELSNAAMTLASERALQFFDRYVKK